MLLAQLVPPCLLLITNIIATIIANTCLVPSVDRGEEEQGEVEAGSAELRSRSQCTELLLQNDIFAKSMSLDPRSMISLLEIPKTTCPHGEGHPIKNI